MADGQPQPQQPRLRMAPYRETFWVMAMSLLTPIGVALIILISFKTLTIEGALLAGDVAGAIFHRTAVRVLPHQLARPDGRQVPGLS